MAIALRLTFQPSSSASPAPSFTIEVTSTSFDIEQTLNIGSSSSGAGVGKVTFNPFSFTKKSDVHSADLWLRCCNGSPYAKATLNAMANGSTTPFFSFTMGLAAVKTVSFAASESDGTALEVVTLEYGQAIYAVTPQNADGTFGATVASGWDRVKNIQIDPPRLG